MINKYAIPVGLIFCLAFSGCAQLLGVKPLIEVPQRPEREVVASREVSTQAIAALSRSEDNKVDKMQELAKEVTKARMASIEAITREAITQARDNPNAVANVAENAFIALDDVVVDFLQILKEVDGTKGYVSDLTGEYIKAGRISDLVKLASLAGQTAVASAVYPEVQKKFTAFARWTFSDLIPYIAGVGIPGVGGLVALGIKLIGSSRRRREDEQALEETIAGNQEVINKYGSLDIGGGKTLKEIFKAILSSKHSRVKKDMNALVEKVRKEKNLEPKPTG